jgi:hypothetical protein
MSSLADANKVPYGGGREDTVSWCGLLVVRKSCFMEVSHTAHHEDHRCPLPQLALWSIQSTSGLPFGTLTPNPRLGTQNIDPILHCASMTFMPGLSPH